MTILTVLRSATQKNTLQSPWSKNSPLVIASQIMLSKLRPLVQTTRSRCSCSAPNLGSKTVEQRLPQMSVKKTKPRSKTAKSRLFHLNRSLKAAG